MVIGSESREDDREESGVEVVASTLREVEEEVMLAGGADAERNPPLGALKKSIVNVIPGLAKVRVYCAVDKPVAYSSDWESELK